MNFAAPHSPHARPSGPRCVGRESDLARLGEALDHVGTRGGTFVAVTGPAGIGKSTFLTEAQRRLRERGTFVLTARCRPGLPSLQPLVDLVGALLARLCDGAGGYAAAPELLAEAEELLAILRGKRARPGDRITVFDGLAQLLRAAADVQPLAVLLHDIDLADAGTRQAVGYLARVLTSPPELTAQRFAGLLVVTAGGIDDVAWEPRWSDGIALLHVELEGIDREGIRAYLASDAVLDKVLEVTDGVPQLLEELIGGEYATRSRTPLDNATGAEAEALKVLAAFGRPLGAETLSALTAQSRESLTRALGALLERQLLEKTIVSGELRVAYRRVGDERAVYDAMPAAERHDLHAAIGYHLRGDDDDLETCADHLLLGRCGDDAVSTARRAAQRLEIAFCYERASDLYERALEQTGDTSTQAELLHALCTIFENSAQLDRALEIATRLREATPDDLAAALRVARLHLRRGDFGTARRELSTLVARAEREGAPRALSAQMLAEQAEAHALEGQRSAAREAAQRGLASCDARADQLPTRLGLQNTLGKLALDDADLDAARQLFTDNLERADAAGLAAETARAHIQLGLAAMQAGDYDDAGEHYEAGRQLAASLGEHRYLGACLQHLGVLAERRRDYGRAVECYQEAVSNWKKVGHRSYLAWVGLDLSKLYLDLGDVARASAMLNLADKLADVEPPLATRISREILRGRLARAACNYAEAADRFARAIALATAADQNDRAARARLELVSLQLERGDRRAARQLITSLLLDNVRDSLRLRALLLRAALDESGGDDDRSSSDDVLIAETRLGLVQALELAATLEDREASWEARYRLALLDRRQGRENEARRRLLEAARIEAEVREGVPKDLRATMAEQPLRVALRSALAGTAFADGADEGQLEPVDRDVLPAQRLQRERFSAIIGDHPRVQQVLLHVEKVAATDATVLIRGESGTGKELIADAIHARSARADHPLVKVNCGALVESLLLSELFGHERGSFTGATQRKVGRFELANGGSIFLDEIGDISPKTQVALLRVLQERSFERVGGTSPIHVDVRIVFATNRNLERMVAEGQFREDLYYRLRGVQIDLPALRERASDIGLLSAHFLRRIATERDGEPKGLDTSAIELLSRYGWPGNIRELENVLRSVSLFSEDRLLGAADFADYPELAASTPIVASEQESTTSAYELLRSQGLSLRDFKKQVEAACIRHALDESDGNITRAAELLGMKRPRLSQLIKEHGLAQR